MAEQPGSAPNVLTPTRSSLLAFLPVRRVLLAPACEILHYSWIDDGICLELTTVLSRGRKIKVIIKREKKNPTTAAQGWKKRGGGGERTRIDKTFVKRTPDC